MINARALLGSHDVLFITLDSLRYDVACNALEQGMTPYLKSLLPSGEWELRHTPGNFTYSAHQAFFAGFLPTPVTPGTHPRLFAARFAGSETSNEQTCVFDAPDIVTGFAQSGYHTICIGGVGFFNKQNPLGDVLPSLFKESYWDSKLGVTDPQSTQHQVELALELLAKIPNEKRVFLFINISALHQPNCIFLPGSSKDSAETQRAALAYVDSQLPPLIDAMRKRAPLLSLILSDHGTAYGEDGFIGHRLNHPVVCNVPYMQAVWPKDGGSLPP